MNKKIGYIINESAMETVDYAIDEGAVLTLAESAKDLPFYNPNRKVGFARLQSGNERNRNGRMYRTEDLEREIAAPRQRELLSTGNMCGEAGHPLSKELIRQQTIDPTCTCVRYLKFWMSGDDVLAIYQGTNNDKGKTVDDDLRIGVKPAFSLRALGTINATPAGAVVENLKMITYDYVIYPSHKGAYTSGVITESASGIALPQSGFKIANNMDASKSFITEFDNASVMKAIQQVNESAAIVDYIKDKSFNYYLLKECYDMTKFDTIDLINDHQVALTEAGNETIVMNIEDYIAKEIQNYRR